MAAASSDVHGHDEPVPATGIAWREGHVDGDQSRQFNRVRPAGVPADAAVVVLIAVIAETDIDHISQ